MQKFAIITVLAGLTMAFTTIASSAAIVRPRHPTAVSQTSHTECIESLGHFRSVHRDDIDAIDGQSVMVIHVCDENSLLSDASYGSLFIDGNVNTLRRPIAHNYTLMSALDEEGLDQNDVVSLRFGGNDSIVLYVYDRDMR
ncbi:MAG: hypothetical protein JWP26_3221 [Devosia sp.]|uniref:hypothetical protein n=1 Tax=Devosia sp. TaxID=1871048 RepID=UPI0026290EBF|nr:hypothetical protein [Devosia sp.]MDB5538095.1 hypothetical protein [Devosia sp.]MDB5588251.1 hypothetical protein [Devosia sp.]